MAELSSYNRVTWQDSPDTSTPVNATNLNKMDSQIKALSTIVGEGVGLSTYANIVTGVNTVSAGLRNGSVTKVGTSNVGSNIKPIYLEGGVPRETNQNIGSATKLIYMENGELKQSTTTGDNKSLYYQNSGAITKSTASLGNGAKHIYLENGTLKESTSSVGSGTKPIYLEGGTLKGSNANVGSAKKLMYLSSGSLTASSASVGSVNNPVYLQNGEVKECKGTSDTKVLWYTFDLTVEANSNKNVVHYFYENEMISGYYISTNSLVNITFDNQISSGNGANSSFMNSFNSYVANMNPDDPIDVGMTGQYLSVNVRNFANSQAKVRCKVQILAFKNTD